MMKQVVSVFTFQYGSTSMKLYYEAHVQDIGIYIPIWFYFNCVSYISKKGGKKFTFQYGSTSISTDNGTTFKNNTFTFQYGSTSIRRPKSPLNPVFLTTILSTFFSHKIQYIIITIFYHLFFHFSLIFQQLSTSQDFHFTSGRQSQEITCFIILYTPHFFWYPLFIPALEHNNRISIFSNFRF